MTEQAEKPKKPAPGEIPRNKVTEWVTLEDGIQMRASSQRLEDAEAWVAKVLPGCDCIHYERDLDGPFEASTEEG